MEHAEKAIEAARKIANLSKDQLNIGFVAGGRNENFSLYHAEYTGSFPDIKINFHSLTDANQLKALKKKATLTLPLPVMSMQSDELEHVQIFSEPLALIVPKDSPIAEQRHISIKSFNHQDFVISDEGASPQLYKDY